MEIQKVRLEPVCAAQFSPPCWIYSCRVYGMGTTVHIEACWFPSSNRLNSQSQNLYCYQTHIWKIFPFPQVHCYHLSALTSSLSYCQIWQHPKQGKKWTKNLNEMSSNSLLVTHHIVSYTSHSIFQSYLWQGFNSYWKYIENRNFWMIVWLLNNWSAVLPNAEHDLYGYATHSFILHTCDNSMQQNSGQDYSIKLCWWYSLAF